MRYTMNKKQKGFTLIETFLYLAISVVMVVLIGSVGINVLATLASVHAEEELQYNSQFIIEKIRTIVNDAETIDIPISGATSSTLSLTMSDPAKNPTVIDVVDGRFRMQEGSDTPQFFSGQNIVVSAVTFSNVTYTGSDGAVRVSFDLNVQNSNTKPSSHAITTIVTTINVQYP